MKQFNQFGGISQHFKLIFILIGAFIIVASTYFSNRLAKALALEEQKKIELWAEATRQFVLADETVDIEFLLHVIENNTTIPILIVDENGEVQQSRNIKEPKVNVKTFYAEKIKEYGAKHEPICVNLDSVQHYVYYDDSLLLKQLYYFPYFQFGIIILFLIIVYFAFSSTKRSEQNRVWVGLSKETAHQLGTPISSLLAWSDLLRMKHKDEALLDEMNKDLNRLQVIAERFSKIGSTPELKLVSLNETLEHAVQYLSKRSSDKVKFCVKSHSSNPLFVKLNIPLFEWVIENLCKNAIDAMDGDGQITIELTDQDRLVYIDIQDTGKGIERKFFKTVFKPGYTTKKRGWGLGLSLVKRIIEDYHQGKIFVKQSELRIGTTFRIVLKV